MPRIVNWRNSADVRRPDEGGDRRSSDARRRASSYRAVGAPEAALGERRAGDGAEPGDPRASVPQQFRNPPPAGSTRRHAPSSTVMTTKQSPITLAGRVAGREEAVAGVVGHGLRGRRRPRRASGAPPASRSARANMSAAAHAMIGEEVGLSSPARCAGTTRGRSPSAGTAPASSKIENVTASVVPFGGVAGELEELPAVGLGAVEGHLRLVADLLEGLGQAGHARDLERGDDELAAGVLDLLGDVDVVRLGDRHLEGRRRW